MPSKNKKNKDLNTENELLKIKLNLEHGAHFEGSEESTLPPEIENQWLKYIQQFENAYVEEKRTTVFKFIGEPIYRSFGDLKPEEITDELKRLTIIMNTAGIKLDTICTVNEEVLCRFITEELFPYEIDDIRVEGLMHNFIYEEFHPNNEYDIEEACRDFVSSFMNTTQLPEPHFIHLNAEINSNAGMIDSANAVKRMEAFRSVFSNFKIKNFVLKSINIKDTEGTAIFELDYNCNSSTGKSNFAGEAIFTLINTFDYWNIIGINLPGFNL